MEKDIEHIKKALNRNRLAVFSVIAFLALITYLLIVVSQGVSEQASISTSSQASELDVEDSEEYGTMMPIQPSGIFPPSCKDYSEYIKAMKDRARRAAAHIKYKVKVNGQVLKGTCDRYIVDWVIPTGIQTNGSAEPYAPIDTPSQCEDIRILYLELEQLEKFMQAKCKQCPGEAIYPTPTYIIPRPTQNQAITLPSGSINDGGTQQDPSSLYDGAR